MFEEAQPLKPGMTLPVNAHIERLGELLIEVAQDLEDSERELHMLRGSITELSYLSKEADQELNRFLVENIASLKRDLLIVDRNHKSQLRENRDRLAALQIQQEDIGGQLHTHTESINSLEEKVGLAPPAHH